MANMGRIPSLSPMVMPSNWPMKPTSKFTARDIVSIGCMTAILEAVKWTLSSIPGVELVSFFLILFTIFYGWKTILAALGFAFLEIILWGMGIWNFMYIYMWPLLVALTMLVRKYDSIWAYTFLSAGFGLCFGALCSIPYLLIGGPITMFTWWIAGIPYDIAHGIANFLIMILLYKPVYHVMEKVFTKYKMQP
jgi:energy-coupling factor transport system substrate-specific component